MADESRLLEIASAIAEGADVDWDEVERQSPDEVERSVIHELRVVARMANAARNLPVGEVESDHSKAWGHLTLIQEIGRGSFGTVYRAWDTNLECEVALKLTPAAPRAGSVSRALKEARLLARVRHQHVVSVYGAECFDGVFGLWMERINGRTLEDVLKFHGPMGAREASLIAVDLCHALAAVHRAGLLHRDIKATNVMREGGGRIVLMDFGAGLEIPRGDALTDDMAGTPAYLAPELFRDGKPSVASDIYGLGVLLYHLVTGRYPIEAKNRQELEQAHAQGTRQLLRDARPDLPSAFIEVVERSLSPNPGERYQSAGSFGAAIAGIGGVSYKEEPLPGHRARNLILAGVTATVLVLAALLLRDIRFGSEPEIEGDLASNATVAQPAVPPAPAADAAGTYRVNASFHTVRDGGNARLTANNRITPGDRLFMTLELSQPAYVYIINQDDKGESFLLFPLPGQELTNPVPAGQANRLPGTRSGEELYWQVTSAGGREHFFVFVTPERLTAFEQILSALPRAELGRPVLSAQLSREAVGTLRGVGGLTKTGQSALPPGAAQLADIDPLSDGGETARGLWARQITFENPSK